MVVETIAVEVAYATLERQTIISVTLPIGSTIIQAIEASNLLPLYPEIDLTSGKIGIFGQICPANKVLTEGDRVEVYRPLQQDPMSARRERLRR